ncbi:MAG: hypothetical protein RSA66_06550 [Muribaculaceae bacterium]
MKNYSRFYGLLAKLPIHNEQMKEEFVAGFTEGRTSSLKEMTSAEYEMMCDSLEASLNQKSHLRGFRSQALIAMQRIGIDTTDWTRINAFCEDKRIAGKAFYHLSEPELVALTVKLRSIARNGGLKPHPKPESAVQPAPKQKVIYIPLTGGGEA